NGAPYLIDDGDDSVFTGLEPGFYGFTVQDACGVIKPGFFDVSQLPAIVTATAPGNLIECDDESNDGIVPFDLTSQIPGIITNQDPSTLTVTFHNSLQDADDNLNIIATPTNYSSSGETVYVRVLHSGGCHETTSFNLVINPSPQFEIDDQVPICVDGTTTLSVPAGFSSYEWSTGEITRQITVDTPGSYSVIVTNNYPTGSCSSTQNFTVFQSAPPVITDVVVTDWTQDQNTITVELQNASGGNYVFSLDNINFQPSNVFTGLTAGVYNVFVKDLNGCGDDSQEVFILSYPPFFTPNADGFNDYWRVRFAELEPNLQTYIYDRYGKLITGFLSGSQGWDGTLNGKPLFATDYWFVVIRQDGRTLRGHFALKR
nr:T9SS type B sorting domain-containing protein [Flavobacterium sp.]